MGKGIFGYLNDIRSGQSGNIFFTMFGAVALVGAIGAASMTVMKGPVRTMSEVTKKTIAENNMMASAKLSVMGATTGTNAGDCDTDGYIEPVMFEAATSLPAPGGGGHLPASIGASLQDPWNNRYGYCVWDHGPATMQNSCQDPPGSGPNNRLSGFNQSDQVSLAVISAGPDKTFQTQCISAAQADSEGNGNGIIDGNEQILVRVAGSDDIIHSYTYAQANSVGGGLWNIKAGDTETAQIQKNLEVKDSGGNVTFSLDADTGIGEFEQIKTDNIYSRTASTPISIHDPMRFVGVAGAVPTYLSGGPVQQDTLGALSCSTNQVVKWNGTAWACANDTDTDSLAALACGNGQVVKRSGGAWGCGTDNAVNGADNLGNHTATGALSMATFNINNAGTVTASSFMHSSDRGLKDDITDITDPFAILTAIHGKHYVWKKDGKPAFGVIAQDVETVMPEAVITKEDGTKAVEYDQLIAPLLEAIKILKSENDELQKEIDALKQTR